MDASATDVEASAEDLAVAHVSEHPRASGPSSDSSEKMRQQALKEQIRIIQSSKTLTPGEKAKCMQNLMMQQWMKSQKDTDTSMKSTMQVKPRTLVTYHDEENKVLGCPHYRRGCKIQAACCERWYTCRFCHDDNEDHAIDRYTIERISCMSCHTEQSVARECINDACRVEFAHYFCSVCNFYDDDPEKEIYHCEKCRICRIGKGLDVDYFHCDRCNACMSISLRDHKCIERSLESDCPICHAFMFTSTTPVMFLPCGHCMHVLCYEEYTMTNYICPLCSKSLGDMELYFASIDEHLRHEEMPDEYKDVQSLIFCNDCERKSITSFHFVYHKCQYPDCKSYNTRLLRQYRDTENEEGKDEFTINEEDETMLSDRDD